ncbi:MAG: hypothetical protein WCH01_12725 [Methylococcaceae bacterium]
MNKIKIGTMVAGALFATAISSSAFAVTLPCEIEAVIAAHDRDSDAIYIKGEGLKAGNRRTHVRVEVCGHKARGHVRIHSDGDFMSRFELSDNTAGDVNKNCQVEVRQELNQYTNIECDAGALINAINFVHVEAAAPIAGPTPLQEFDALSGDTEIILDQ